MCSDDLTIPPGGDVTTETGPKPNPMQKYVDAMMRRLLRSPLHVILSKKIMLMEVIGRKSGKRYVIPIAYGEYGEDVLVGASKAKWLRNLTPERTVTLTIRGRQRAAYPELLTDEYLVAELYPHIVKDNQAHAKFQQLRVNPNGSINRHDLHAALARGLTLIRLRPA